MAISQDEVAHVAWLARLELTAEEKARYTDQLSDVLEHVESLRKLDLRDVPPMAMAVDEQENVTRADEPWESLPRDAVLQNAADTEDGSFRVRAILEETA